MKLATFNDGTRDGALLAVSSDLQFAARADHVARTIKDAIEVYGASIGRYGGEEFIVLAQFAERERVAELAECIRATVEQMGLIHEERRDGTSIVTVSIGAAYTRDQSGKLEKIIHEADRALYSAKASGRNCARLFDPNDPFSSDESENIAALLRIAAAQDLLSLVYQPIEDMRTGRRDAVEALMRLKTLDGSSIPPSLFIPIAERTGMILELGRWVIQTACREVLAPNLAQIASVNVSPIQLRMPGFAASVAAIWLWVTGAMLERSPSGRVSGPMTASQVFSAPTTSPPWCFQSAPLPRP